MRRGCFLQPRHSSTACSVPKTVNLHMSHLWLASWSQCICWSGLCKHERERTCSLVSCIQYAARLPPQRWSSTSKQGRVRSDAHLKTCDERYTLPGRIPRGAVPLMSRKLKPPKLDTLPCTRVHDICNHGSECAQRRRFVVRRA